MSIIQKTQIHNYHDKFTNEYMPKGGYLVSDLMKTSDIEMLKEQVEKLTKLLEAKVPEDEKAV